MFADFLEILLAPLTSFLLEDARWGSGLGYKKVIVLIKERRGQTNSCCLALFLSIEARLRQPYDTYSYAQRECTSI